MADDLGRQAELQQQISKSLKEQADLMQKQSKLMGQQANYSKEMYESLKKTNLSSLKDQTEEVTEGLKDAADQAEVTSDKMAGLSDKGSFLGDVFSKIAENGTKIGAVVGIFTGLAAGAKMFFGVLKAGATIVFRVMSTLFKLGQTLISLPFKILQNLIEASQKGGENPLWKALEDVRESFGNIATNEGKMLRDSYINLRSQMSDMAGTGLRMGRVFGYGRQGLATFIKDELLPVANAAGIAFGKLKGEFENNATALAMYRRGLGLTAEQMATMMKVTKDRGKSIKEETREFASYAITMGKSFGLNAKVVGKAMGEMASDVSNFGHMSTKQFAATATYAAKLGIEIKDMMGLFDKYDNFENAAKGAAELSQAFGMNVDAIAMLKAESPAEAVDMLRKSFFAAGHSLESMNRHQRRMLEQQTGLKGAAMEAAFGVENQGLAYADIEAGAEAAEKKQMSQAEAMVHLSKSIKKMTTTGSHGFKSFFDSFLKGFNKGIERSKEFRAIMRNLRKSLRAVYRSGCRVGRLFVELFPGVKDIAMALGDLMKPENFKAALLETERLFGKFFKDIGDPKKAEKATGDLIDGLKKMLEMKLGKDGALLNTIWEGFKNFAKAGVQIVASALKEVIVEIKEWLTNINEALTKNMAVIAKGGEGKSFWDILAASFEINSKDAAAAGTSMMAQIKGIFQPLIKLIFDKDLMQGLSDAFTNFIKTFWKAHGDDIKGALKEVSSEMNLGWWMAAGVGTSIMSGFLPSLFAGFSIEAAKSMWNKRVGGQLAPTISQGVQNTLKVVGSDPKIANAARNTGRAVAETVAKNSDEAFRAVQGGRILLSPSTARAITEETASAAANIADDATKAIASAGDDVAAAASGRTGFFSRAFGSLTKGAEKVTATLGKVGGPLMKAAGTVGSGVAKVLGFGIRRGATKIPLAGMFISLGLGAYDVYRQNEEKPGSSWGQLGKRMAATMISNMGFGLAGSSDELYEHMERPLSEADEIQREYRAKSAAATDKFLQSQVGALRNYSSQVLSALVPLEKAASAVHGALTDAGVGLDAKAKKALAASQKMLTDLRLSAVKQTKDVQKFTIEEAKRAAAFKTSAERLLDEDVNVGWGPDWLHSTMEIRLQRDGAFRKALDAANIAFTHTTDGLLEISTDDRERAAAVFQKMTDENAMTTRAQGKASLESVLRTQEILSKTSVETLKAAIGAVDSGSAAARTLREQLKAKVRQESMLKILTEAGVKTKGADIRVEYAKYRESLRTSMDAAAQKKFLEIEKDVSDAVTAALPEMARKAKLDKLEAAQGALLRIEALKDVPKRLKAVKKTIAEIDVKELEPEIKAMFTKMAELSDLFNVEASQVGSVSLANGLESTMTSLDILEGAFMKFDASMMASPLLTDPQHVATIVRSIQTMNDLMTPMAETVAEVQAFSGGDLRVTHNIPNTKIEVKVNLSAENIAKTIAHVDVSKDFARGKASIAVQEGGPSALAGSPK